MNVSGPRRLSVFTYDTLILTKSQGIHWNLVKLTCLKAGAEWLGSPATREEEQGWHSWAPHSSHLDLPTIACFLSTWGEDTLQQNWGFFLHCSSLAWFKPSWGKGRKMPKVLISPGLSKLSVTLGAWTPWALRQALIWHTGRCRGILGSYHAHG